MIIIYPADKINDYLELGAYPHLKIPDVCPTCHEKQILVRIGYYERWACTGKEECKLRIGRIFCKKCKTSNALLPAFLMPRKQSTCRVIAAFLQQRILKGETLKKAMEFATEEHPMRQRGASWIKSMMMKLPQIQHYLAERFHRFQVSEKLPEKIKELKTLHLFLDLMLSGWEKVGEALSFHSYSFHQETGMFLI